MNRSLPVLLLLLAACSSGNGEHNPDTDSVATDGGPTGNTETTDHAPMAQDDATNLAEGGTASIDVVANDEDIDGDLDPSSVTVTVLPTHGTVEVDATGTATYVNDGGDTAADSFAYVVADSHGNTSNVATVSITVSPVSDPPVAVDDAAAVDEGGMVVIDLLANDIDDDGLDPTSIRIASSAASGTVSLPGDGTAVYTHDGSETSADVFQYQVRDLSGIFSNVATVTVDVALVEEPPVAVDDFATLVAGAAVQVDVAANDDDPEGQLDLGSISIVSPPSVGTAVANADGTVTYTHGGGPVVEDELTYTIADLAGQVSNVATVTLRQEPPLGCGPVTLDPAFAGDGTVNPLTPGTDYDDGAYAAAIQPDGKTVLGGRYYRNAYGRTVSMTRVDATGALDPTFGGDGYAEDLFQVDSSVYGIAVQPGDGYIAAAGAMLGDLLVFRLQPDGTFDNTFGVNGVVTVPSIDVSYDAHAMLALQPDGDLLAVGSTGGDFAVVRLLPDGTPDPAFGVGGIATVDLGGAETAYTLLLQPDGSILAAGSSDGDFAIVRLDATGALDPTFGGGSGSVVVDVSGADDEAYGLALQGTDIIAVGAADLTFDYLYDTGWGIVRLLSDGSFDLAFGNKGVVWDPIPPNVLAGTGNNDRAYAVAGVSEGAILVAGQAQWNDGFGRMLVARYLEDGTPDPCFDGDGYYTQDTWDIFAQSDAAHFVSVGPDGSWTVVGAVNPSAFGYEGILHALP
jgi:uncharacterized delta-60 repeat protein